MTESDKVGRAIHEARARTYGSWWEYLDSLEFLLMMYS